MVSRWKSVAADAARAETKAAKAAKMICTASYVFI